MDEIPYEFLKNGGEGAVLNMFNLFKTIFQQERVPKSWNESIVNLIHKGGGKSKKNLQNFRPITLSDTIGKVFCGILGNRIENICESMGIFEEEQNGFR